MARPKALTRAQLEGRKARAEAFSRGVRDDPDLADQIASESLEEYAAHRGIELLNPLEREKATMATKRRATREALEDRIAELEEQLQDAESERDDALDKLDEIEDVLGGEEGGEEEEEED